MKLQSKIKFRPGTCRTNNSLCLVSWITWAEAQYRGSPLAYWCHCLCRGHTASPSSQRWTGTVDWCRALPSQPAAGLEVGPEPPRYWSADDCGPATRKTAAPGGAEKYRTIEGRQERKDRMTERIKGWILKAVQPRPPQNTNNCRILSQKRRWQLK